MKPAVTIAALTLLLAGCSRVAEGQARRVSDLQVHEATRDYEAAHKHGDALGMCVKAKLVAIAYADARDEANAGAWKAREAADCNAAMDALHVTPPLGRATAP